MSKQAVAKPLKLIPKLAILGSVAGLAAWVGRLLTKVRSHAVKLTELVTLHKRLNAKHTIVLEAATDVVATLSPAGNLVSLNPAFERVTGWSRKEWLGRPFKDLVADVDVPRVTTNVARVAKEASPESWEVRVPRKGGGNVLFEFSGNPHVEEGKVTEVISVGKDITKQRMLENELRRNNESLEKEVARRTLQLEERAEQLRCNAKHLEETAANLKASNEELDRFAHIVSHDLREPIRTVISFLDLLKLKHRKDFSREANAYIQFATDGAKRMDKLVNGLFEYSTAGLSAGSQFKNVDCASLIDEVLLDLKKAIEDYQATIRVDAGMPVISANPVQLSQVFQNLINNSLKYRSDNPPQIRVSCELEGNEYLFSVSDNGIGIDMKNASRVFDLFERLHSREAYPGTGLGLALCKKFVQLHGGRIWVESSLVAGCTFRFSIPKNRTSSQEQVG